jgi:hypothetical protein
MSYNLGQIDPEEEPALYADPRDREPRARPRRMLRAGAALLVMGLFAGGLWFAYAAGMRQSNGAGDIPLIRADTRPMKARPTDPGGMPIPDRDMLIYGQSRPAVEHLLPAPEQPMARPAPPPPTSPPPAPAQAAALPPSAAPSAGSVETTPAAAAPNGATAAALPAPGAPAHPEQMAAVPPANPRSASPRTAPAGAAATRTGGVRLQLGAVRSEEVARAEWDRIKRRNADLLGNLSAVAIRADLGGKGVYYRIQAGPVGDASTADRVCGELRQRHLGCIIVR